MGEFAVVVRRFMKARGMSLRETARAAGYSDHTLLSKALNGRKPVTPYLAACLDDALGAGGEIIAVAQATGRSPMPRGCRCGNWPTTRPSSEPGPRQAPPGRAVSPPSTTR
jgi:transcriptional regulator with XRE-family HTH domain